MPPLRSERRAFLDPRHNQAHYEHVGFFGLFECVDDPAVAGALFDAKSYRHALAKGIRRGEASWILVTNTPMRRALEKMGFTISKTNRIYDRELLP